MDDRGACPAEGYTEWIFTWLDQVQQDPGVGPATFELAYVLCRYINRETRLAWPSQFTLAARLRMSQRHLRSLLAHLEARGHLEILRGLGRGHTSRYRPILKTGNGRSAFPQERRNPSAAFDAKNAEVRVRQSSRKSGSPASEKEEARFRQNYLKEQEQRARASWPGPTWVRNAVVKHPQLGEGWASSWLDACGWRDLPNPTVVCPAGTERADRMKRDARRLLEGLGVTIAEEVIS